MESEALWIPKCYLDAYVLDKVALLIRAVSLSIRDPLQTGSTGGGAKGVDALNDIEMATLETKQLISGLRLQIRLTPPATTTVALKVVEIFQGDFHFISPSTQRARGSITRLRRWCLDRGQSPEGLSLPVGLLG